jgi:hypothetical protein
MLLAGIVLASGTCCLAQETPAADVPKAYASPREAFDAFQKACLWHDWRTAYFCLTPERQDNFVFESFFTCAMHKDKPAVQAVLTKYVTNGEAAGAEYSKRYREKYGVDFQKAQDEYYEKYNKAVAEYRKSHPPKPGEEHVLPSSDEVNVGPQPTADEKLLRKFIVDSVGEKPGFIEAVEKAFNHPDDGLMGALTDVQMEGDSGTGRTSSHGGLPILQHFQKLHGSWLVRQIEFISAEPPRIDAAKH